MKVWKSIIDDSMKYLLDLETDDGSLMTKHRRKAFVVGFVMAAFSTRLLAEDLLTQVDDPFKYFLTYKFSQDHLELLFPYTSYVRFQQQRRCGKV